MSSPTFLSLAGLYPPIPTPFSESGEVDYESLQANLRKWNQEPLAGYVVQGSNGEFPYLSVDERVDVVRAAREVIPADRLLIAGSGMESARGTIDLTRRMAAAGADLAIVVTPSFYASQMTGPALEQYYLQVASSSPIPLLLYSVPANTGIDLPADIIVNLAGQPKIVGLKESGGNLAKIGWLVQETPPEFQVLAGSAGFFLPALAVGAVGGVLALANVGAAQLAKLLQLHRQGDLATAATIQRRLIEPNTALTARFGVAGLKAALDMMGYYGGPVRSPLLPLSAADRATLRAILVAAGILTE